MLRIAKEKQTEPFPSSNAEENGRARSGKKYSGKKFTIKVYNPLGFSSYVFSKILPFVGT